MSVDIFTPNPDDIPDEDASGETPIVIDDIRKADDRPVDLQWMSENFISGSEPPRAPTCPKVIPSGNGFVGKRRGIDYPEYFDRDRQWRESYNGPPDTVCTRPFKTKDAAEEAICDDAIAASERLARSERETDWTPADRRNRSKESIFCVGKSIT